MAERKVFIDLGSETEVTTALRHEVEVARPMIWSCRADRPQIAGKRVS